MSEWKPVKDYEGKYEVSDQGEVRTASGMVLTQWLNSHGYLLVRLSGPRAVARVHRLIAKAFVPNPDSKPFVNHIDCVRNNNLWCNLEWCTQPENLKHSRDLGRMQNDYWTGKRSPNAMLSDGQVKSIRRLYATGKYSWESLSKEFEISKRAIGRIIKEETYTNV